MSSERGKGMGTSALKSVTCGQVYSKHLSSDGLRVESNRPKLQRFEITHRIARDEGDDDPARSAFIDEVLAKRRGGATE